MTERRYVCIALLLALCLQPAYAAQLEDQRVGPYGSDQSWLLFGLDLDISGDYAVVGAPLEIREGNQVGAIYIYEYQGHAWVEVGKPLPSGLVCPGQWQACDFGESVVISGSHLLASAPGSSPQGEAIFYERVPFSQPGQWIEVLQAAPSVPTTRFGAAVALHRNRAAITSVDTLTLFEKVSGSWTEVQVIELQPASLPFSVSLRGDYLALGNESSREVKIYHHDGSSYTEIATVGNPYPSERNRFGNAVSIASNGEVLVGARAHRSTGAAFLFSPTDGWGRAEEIPAQPHQDIFGDEVVLSGDYMLISDLGYERTLPGTNVTVSGAAFAYVRRPFGWTDLAELNASDNPPIRDLGVSAAFSGGRALLGTTFDLQGEACFYSGIICSQDSEAPEIIESRIDERSQEITFGDDTSVLEIEISELTNAIVEFVDPIPEWFEETEPGADWAARHGLERRPKRQFADDEHDIPGTSHYDENPSKIKVAIRRAEPDLPFEVELVVRDPCGQENAFRFWN